jgi:hypothetical protein
MMLIAQEVLCIVREGKRENEKKEEERKKKRRKKL